MGLSLGTELVANLLHLLVDSIVVGRSAVHLHECVSSLFDSATAVVKSRSFAKRQHANAKDDGPDPAKTNDDAPRGRAVFLVRIRAVVEAGGQEDSHGDEQLVGTDESATNPRGRRLGLIHGDQQTEGTDTKAGHQSTDHDLFPSSKGRDLNDKANRDDDTPETDGNAAADPISNRGSHESADQCANGQQTNNQARSDIAESVFVSLTLTKSFQKVGHLQETRNLTGIITARGVIQR